jgi:hypothetical protein
MARNKTDAPLQALFERQQFSNVAYQFFAASILALITSNRLIMAKQISSTR